MSEKFEITVAWLDGSGSDPVERATFAQIVINAAQQVTTELEDLAARTTRPGLRACAYDLARWLAENWWRLRWEPEETTIDWRLSHVVAAVGGGAAWPDVSFASDGVHVLVEARTTSGGPGAPVRYLHDVDVQIPATSFETGVDEFVECVLARLSSVGGAETDLRDLWRVVRDERCDPEMTALRRLEALLGFDPDEAPDGLIAQLRALAPEVGHDAIDEIAAGAKVGAFETLGDILDRTRTSGVSIRIEDAPGIFRRYSDRTSPTEQPWRRARTAAKVARTAWGIDHGPVSNENLSALLKIESTLLGYTQSDALPIAAGLRTNHGADDVNVVMRAKMPTGRRFEILRLAADHIFAPAEDRLLPVTTARTDRQKFQRAFAQEFLLPFDELYARLDRPVLGEGEISDDDIDDVAEEYDVSPLLVRTTLVNQGVLSRAGLDGP